MRDYALTVMIVVPLLAAILYKPISLSSPVAETSRFNGLVVAITASGVRSPGSRNWYGYRIQPDDGGKVFDVRLQSLHRVGDRLNMDRIVRSNGNVTYHLVGSQGP